MTFDVDRYNITIYGDGLHEYDGFYMAIIEEFDENDKPTDEKYAYYFKANSIKVVLDYLMNNVDQIFGYRNYSKWILTPIIQATKIQ